MCRRPILYEQKFIENNNNNNNNVYFIHKDIYKKKLNYKPTNKDASSLDCISISNNIYRTSNLWDFTQSSEATG